MDDFYSSIHDNGANDYITKEEHGKVVSKAVKKATKPLNKKTKDLRKDLQFLGEEITALKLAVDESDQHQGAIVEAIVRIDERCKQQVPQMAQEIQNLKSEVRQLRQKLVKYSDLNSRLRVLEGRSHRLTSTSIAKRRHQLRTKAARNSLPNPAFTPRSPDMLPKIDFNSIKKDEESLEDTMSDEDAASVLAGLSEKGTTAPTNQSNTAATTYTAQELFGDSDTDSDDDAALKARLTEELRAQTSNYPRLQRENQGSGGDKSFDG